jgi:hypothetical protein
MKTLKNIEKQIIAAVNQYQAIGFMFINGERNYDCKKPSVF